MQVLLRSSAGPGGSGKAGSKRGRGHKVSNFDVVYFLNGAEVGVAASSVASATVDGLVLAVQPYMGGVALLE